MTRPLIVAAVATLLSAATLCSAAASATKSSQSNVPSSPPRECDIRLPVWCLLQGVDKIELVNQAGASHNDFWILRGSFEPASQLVILEPPGCREELSNILEPVSFDSGIYWNHKIWDRVIVKLKKDGSCNLELLFPPYKGDAMEWAYSNGMMLIRACQDKACGDDNPTTGKIQDLYWKKFKSATTNTPQPEPSS